MHAGVHHDPQGQQSELFVSVNTFTFKVTEVRIPREGIILISVIWIDFGGVLGIFLLNIFFVFCTFV